VRFFSAVQPSSLHLPSEKSFNTDKLI
jgi:hypothetical protein